MMIALMATYLVFLFVIVRLGIVRFNLFWKASPFIVLLFLNLALFIPMGWARRRARRWWSAMPSPSFPMSRAK